MAAAEADVPAGAPLRMTIVPVGGATIVPDGATMVPEGATMVPEGATMVPVSKSTEPCSTIVSECIRGSTSLNRDVPTTAVRDGIVLGLHVSAGSCGRLAGNVAAVLV